jgi:hypothetical protein
LDDSEPDAEAPTGTPASLRGRELIEGVNLSFAGDGFVAAACQVTTRDN